MKAWLWKFFTGYVNIKLEGLKLLQLVNDAAKQGIRLDYTVREGYSRITASLCWRDYRRLMVLARNRPLRVIVLEQGGLPIIGALALKRLAFTLGLVCCIAALVAVNRFVLDVHVTGCTKAGLEQSVYSVLDRQGLKPGTGKWALDLHACEKALMLELQEISFAAIRVTGVRATVAIVEAEAIPELLDRDTPCDIVAGKAAIVRKTLVYEGQANVTPGDAVRAGQVLVAGTVTVLDGVKRVHARADILAGVWYEGRGSVPLFTQSSIRTGVSIERRRLAFAGYELPVGQQEPPGFADFDVEESTVYLLGEGVKGPRLIITTYHEVRRYAESRDLSAAMQEALVIAAAQAHNLTPDGAQVVGQRTDYSYKDGAVLAKVYIETLENIAQEAPIK